MQSIADRLKDLRTSKNETQEVVAEACEISRIALARYEAGTRVPRSEIAAKLADHYGVTVDFLLGRDQPSDPAPVKTRSPEAQAIIDEIMAKILAIPDDAKIQVLNFADFIKAQEDAKK